MSLKFKKISDTLKKVLCFIMILSLCFLLGCDKSIEISLVDGANTSYYVDDSIDYSKLFALKVDGKEVTITDEMIDFSKVDLTKAGTYKVIVNYENEEKEFTFTISNVNIKFDEISNLKVGDSVSLNVICTPERDLSKLTYSTNNDQVISISDNGTITAIGVGTAVIKVTLGNNTVSKMVTVTESDSKDVLVSSITINGNKEMLVSEKQNLSCTVLPDNASNKEVLYTSSDESVVKVNGSTIEALKAGKAVITCKALDNSNVSTTLEITVTENGSEDVLVSSITINGNKEMLVSEKQNLTCTVLPDNASNKEVLYTSSDESVVKVNGSTIEALKAGKVVITCKALDNSNVSTTLEITVTEKQEVPSLTKALEKIIDSNNWNFKIVYINKVLEEDYTYEDTYRFNKEITENTYVGYDENEYTDYLIYIDNVGYFYADYLEEGYELVEEGTADYEEFVSQLTLFDFSNFDSYKYTYENGIFKITDEDKKKANDEIMGEYDVEYSVESVEFVLENELISKITITCKVLDSTDNKWYTYVDEIVFSDYDKVDLKVEDIQKLTEDKPVEKVLVSSITINGKGQMSISEKQNLTCTVLPENASNKEVSWTSSDESVVKVNGNTIEALKVGIAVITCTALDDSKVSTTLEITVDDNPLPEVLVSSITINCKKEMTVLGKQTLSCTLLPENATNTEVLWTSSDESIIKVNGSTIEALKVGTCTLTCTATDSSKVSTTLEITVKEKQDAPSLTKALERIIDSNYWNFSIDYINTIKEVEYSYTDSYRFNKEIIENVYIGEDNNQYKDYLVYIDNVGYFYADYLEDGYELYEEGTSEFEEFASQLVMFDFSNFDKYAYTYEDGVFKITDEDKKKASDEIMGEYDVEYTVESVEFVLENELISKITITCKLLDSTDNKWYTYVDEIVFSDYGEVDLKVEDIQKLVTDKPDNPSDGATFTFKDTKLNDESGESNFSGGTPNSFDSIRGVQFLQKQGNVDLVSKASFNNVSSVSVTVSTNQVLGMEVKVKVGDTFLLCEGKESVKVEKLDFSENKEVTFTSTTPLSGNVTVVLVALGTDKSMYISKIVVGGTGGNTGKVMPSQVYNEETFNDNRLQDYLLSYEEIIGLSSSGEYNVLVIPVEFNGSSAFTADQLAILAKAFNGTSSDTGWESVSSFYNKTSYGKLNMTFDFVDPFKASNSASYYEKYSKSLSDENGDYEHDGSIVLLIEALQYYDKTIDFTKYDNNGDKCIDGIYLIYNYPVNYEDDNNLFWAFTSWYSTTEEDNKTFDGLDVYYYLFAGYDFVNEDAKDGFEYNGKMSEVTINAATYIHETGHMLGLDDYYDYEPKVGSNQGVGGADMMDSTIGDHGAYSKIMLGWSTPEIVTTTKDITIKDFETSGNVILVPLNFNNSYMCEYLLIDLYTDTGLNALHASYDYLYGNSKSGVRIYHVASSNNDPFNNEYGSYTDNNNTNSKNPLLKLVEQDGEKDFNSSNGYVTSNDLWQAGDKLSDLGTYTRYDGLSVNFDIEVISCNASEATIRITYVETPIE